MLEFFRNLSKHTLAMIIIAAGTLLIVLSDPPVTVCGQQIKSFEKDMQGYLVKDSTKPTSRTPRFDRLLEVCHRANALGGCYELFSSIRTALDRARVVSFECLSDLGDSSLARSFLHRSVDIMAKMAWGGAPPAASTLRTGWMEAPQVDLFCRLRDFYSAVYGEGAWGTLREKYLKELPGAAQLGREEAWGRSLFSVNCSGGR
jgi:hypothetical protein